MKEVSGFCYCKKCKEMVQIRQRVIDEHDMMFVRLGCGHERAFQLVTSKNDYKEDRK